MQKQTTKTALCISVFFFAAALLVYAPDIPAQQQDQSRNRMASRNLMAENILDLDIRTKTGENVGEIEDVIFDLNGRISRFIVDVGGFLGMGEKKVAISTGELRFNPDQRYAVFQGTRSDLENKEEIDYYSYRQTYR